MLQAIQNVQEKASELQMPLLFLLGGEDKIIDPKGGEAFFKALSTSATSFNRTLKIYPAFYHELIHEVEKEKVFHDILEWVEQREKKAEVG